MKHYNGKGYKVKKSKAEAKDKKKETFNRIFKGKLHYIILHGLCVAEEVRPISFKRTFFPSIGEFEIDCRWI